MEPLLIDLQEAARLTSLSPHTIRAYIKKGRIPAVRCCRRVLIELHAIRTFIDEGREERDGTSR